MEIVIEPAQTGHPPDGYAQWNTEPPEQYTSWGDYFASISQQASALYRQEWNAFSDRISQHCPEK